MDGWMDVSNWLQDTITVKIEPINLIYQTEISHALLNTPVTMYTLKPWKRENDQSDSRCKNHKKVNFNSSNFPFKETKVRILFISIKI